MNKLQLYITMTQGDDYQEKVEVNPDSYVHSWVSDLSDAVRQISYSPNDKAIFYMVKYIDSGYFITVIRTIPSEAGNNVTAWIYVPYSLHISDKDVYDVVTFVSRKISAASMENKDINELRHLFTHDYEEDLMSPVFPQCEGMNYAYRTYGTGTHVSLADLIGPFRFQLSYLPFAGVLLIDSDITTTAALANLTSAPLDSMAVLLPPDKKDEDGYTPYIFGQEFTVPCYVPMSRSVEVTWHKPKAPEVKRTVNITQTEMRCPAMAKKAPASAPVSETRTDLPQRKKTYRFQIPAKSAAIGTVIEFELTTNNDLDDSPIDGYEATSAIQEGAGRSNHLLYTAEKAPKDWTSNILWAVAGLIVGVLATLLFTCSSSHDEGDAANPKETPAVTVANDTQQPAAADAQPAADGAQAQQQGAAEVQADRSLEAAVKYLDTNKTWEKSEMEAYPDLQGLYDDMNNIDRHKLVEYWGPKLQDSRAFSNQIVHHSKLSYKKKARIKGDRTTFNPPSETKILVQAYLNTIDP